MKGRSAAVMTVLSLTLLLSGIMGASAQGVPEWVKNNAGWWADGIISDAEFVNAVQYLIGEGIIVIPAAAQQAEQAQQGTMPEWVKNNAGWWADGIISDAEFVNAIQFLISAGIISVDMADETDTELSRLQSELEQCAQITKTYKRVDCERAANNAIKAHDYKTNGESFQAGPVTFYYKGNDFEISPMGQALLDIRLLAENSGASENISLMCTGPAICNYDVWDGVKSYRYAGTDFTNGQIVLKPGESREFSMFFGPNIGYGGTKFEYDPARDYAFRVAEPWGSVSIPLDMKADP